MARAGAAVILALAVCCLLVAPAPARRPADLPPRALHAIADREAATEPLRPKTAVAVAADCADAAEAEQAGAALAVHEEDPARDDDEEPRRRSSSLLCLVFRCGGEGEPAGVNGEPQALEDGTVRAVEGKPEAEDEGERPYETDWDSDCDSDSDSDDEGEEGGVLGWLWRLAGRF